MSVSIVRSTLANLDYLLHRFSGTAGSCALVPVVRRPITSSRSQPKAESGASFELTFQRYTYTYRPSLLLPLFFLFPLLTLQFFCHMVSAFFTFAFVLYLNSGTNLRIM